MTLRIPRETVFDKILGLFGVERRLYPPENHDELRSRLGEHSDIYMVKECVLRAILAALTRDHAK